MADMLIQTEKGNNLPQQAGEQTKESLRAHVGRALANLSLMAWEARKCKAEMVIPSMVGQSLQPSPVFLSSWSSEWVLRGWVMPT